MRDFFSALGHLLLRSLFSTVTGWMGTTVLALAVGVIKHYVAPRIDARLHQERPAEKPRLTGSIMLTVFTWLLLYGANVIYTIYREHQNSVKINQALAAQVALRDQRIAQLKTKLAQTCFQPARHFTQDQKKIIYYVLRDLASRIPPRHRRIFLGSVRGDVEAQRFVQFYLYPAFANAGWLISGTFDRPPRKKDADPLYPGNPEGLSVSYTAEQGTAEYKWQNELTNGILGALRQAEVEANEGAVARGDPLKKTNSLVVWVGPQKATSQYEY